MASIAVDVMSGDRGAPECVPGALRALAADPELELILVGNPEIIQAELARASPDMRARAAVHAAASVVAMSEHPRDAIRRRKDSSMRLAIDLVKEGRAAAMVSAGNTGALTAMSHFVLKTVGPVERAPIMSSVPARDGGHTHMLDLGANSKATALQLAQFATMGSIVARDVFGLANPRIGLLNIGEEETKGNELTREAHRLLKHAPVRFIGNIEGRDVFAGHADVVVCDGFTGNITLKLSEGLVDTVEGLLHDELASTFGGRVGYALSRQAFRRFRLRVDHSDYGGAPLVGVNGLCIVAHGRSSAKAIANAVTMASRAVDADLVARLRRDVKALENPLQ